MHRLCVYLWFHLPYLSLLNATHKKKITTIIHGSGTMYAHFLSHKMNAVTKTENTGDLKQTGHIYMCVFIYYAMIKFSNRNGKEIQKPIHIYLHIRRSRTHYIHMCAKFVHCNCNYFPANGRIAAEREIPCNNKREPILFFYEQCWVSAHRYFFCLRFHTFECLKCEEEEKSRIMESLQFHFRALTN